MASEVQRLSEESINKKLVVLSGFNHGEIINSDENFKARFGIALNGFSRNNISEFIPTERQKAKHSQLMN